MPQENVRVTTAALAAVIALVLAGCGDDEDSTTGVDVEEVPTRTLSPKQEIEQKGDNWAALFAAGHDRAACRYEGQPLCERIACERVSTGPIRNCTPPSAAFRKSFEGATVQDVAIQGENAGAKFSNGETVALNGGPPNGAWYIGPIGGDAGREFFEAAGPSE